MALIATNKLVSIATAFNETTRDQGSASEWFGRVKNLIDVFSDVSLIDLIMGMASHQLHYSDRTAGLVYGCVEGSVTK